MNNISIFGGEGQHAEDLQNRGVFNNMNTQVVEQNDGVNIGKTNAIAVTISETENVINQIIDLDNNAEIINLSGIMSTTPKKIRGKENVTNIHYTFGPYRTNKLNAIHNGSITESVDQILYNSKKLGINTIHASIEEHDRCVAITQALSHMYILLSGIKGQNSLTKEWNTPVLTISDMILENSVFKNNYSSFLNELKVGDDLSKIFLDMSTILTKEEKEIFSTPNFLRVIGFCKYNPMIVDEKILEFIKNVNSKKILTKEIFNIKNGNKNISTI